MSALGEDHFCVLNDKVLISLPIGQRLYFKGKLQVNDILNGEIHVFGARFNSDSELPLEIYSPRGYSLIFIEADNCKTESKRLKLSNLGSKDKKIVEKFVKKQSSNSAIFVASKLDLAWTKAVEHKLRFSDSRKQRIALFGREEKWPSQVETIEKILDVSFVNPNEEGPKVRLLQLHSDWEVILQSTSLLSQNGDVPRIVVLGGKGVGKSTLLKFTANRLQQDTKRPVVWIDFDPGQAEYTLPGCVSATLVENPILGPNFTHLKSEKTLINFFLGNVNVSDVMHRYKKGVEFIIDYLRSHSEFCQLPWIVNTMGFNRGLGIALLKQTLKLVNPTNVIEIRSRFAKKNYECSIQSFCSQNFPRCNFMTFEAVPESLNTTQTGGQENWGIPEAYKLRDIVILSHLEQSSLMSSGLVCVPLSSIKLQILQFGTQIPLGKPELILSTSLVSLGKIEPNAKQILGNDLLIESLGFGVVFGYDQDQKLLYLKTNVSEETLENVNVLTCGSIQLPHGCFKHKEGNPYVQQKAQVETPLNVAWQRSSKPRLQEFQANK